MFDPSVKLIHNHYLLSAKTRTSPDGLLHLIKGRERVNSLLEANSKTDGMSKNKTFKRVPIFFWLNQLNFGLVPDNSNKNTEILAGKQVFSQSQRNWKIRWSFAEPNGKQINTLCMEKHSLQ